MSEPAISTESLHKSFGSVTAIQAVSFSVHRGEVFGLLGPNGAGKSTTLNILLGLVPPTDGRVEVFGLNVCNEPRAVRDRIGVLPEDYGLYDQLTGRDHIELFGRLNGEKVNPNSLRETVGLKSGAFDRPVGEYSTGMRQRLALATALIGNPDLLVLDEPMTGLDPDGTRLVRKTITELATNDVSVFISSHRLGVVQSVCDRVGFLDDGSLVSVEEIGATDEFNASERLNLTVDTNPPDDVMSAVRDTTGVGVVTVADRTVTVECHDPESKATVVRKFDKACSVTDLDVVEPDLEELFDTTISNEQTSSATTIAGGDAS